MISNLLYSFPYRRLWFCGAKVGVGWGDSCRCLNVRRRPRGVGGPEALVGMLAPGTGGLVTRG